MHECLHIFICPVLRDTDAHRHMDFPVLIRGEYFFFEFRPDSFRCHGTLRDRGHGQEEGELFAAVAIGMVRFAQASFDHLAEPSQDTISLDMTVRVVEDLEIVDIHHKER